MCTDCGCPVSLVRGERSAWKCPFCGSERAAMSRGQHGTLHLDFVQRPATAASTERTNYAGCALLLSGMLASWALIILVILRIFR